MNGITTPTIYYVIMIYLDNAASSKFKPKAAVKALKTGAKTLFANPGRSSHKHAIASLAAIEQTREIVANFFNAKHHRVVFTSGCTEALNLAIFGSVKPGGNVVTTVFEHNSVLRPLHHLAAQGLITLSIVHPDEINNAINEKTYLIVVNHISNVTGNKVDLTKIKKQNALLLVDSAQSAGHTRIDMENIDLLAFAGHKGLHGFAGSGGLVMSDKVVLKPFKHGGTGTASTSLIQPNDDFEAGTQSAILINALGKSMQWTEKHLNKIEDKTKLLSQYAIDELKKHATVYTTQPNGVIAFNIKDYSSSEVADVLADNNIAVRSGLQCAPLVHKHLSTTEQGIVRASIGWNNKKKDIKKLVSTVASLL